MKSVIIATFILISIIIVIFFGIAYTKAAVSQLCEALDLVIKAVEDDNWEQAQAYFEKLSEIWNRKTSVFSVTHHHHYMEQIEKSMPVMKVFLDTEDLQRFLSEAATLKSEFEHLKESDAISVRNLF